MKKKLIVLMAGITLLLAGCDSSGSTVMQKDYDAVLKELEEIKESYYSQKNELKLLQADNDEKIKELESIQKKLLELRTKYDKEHEEFINLQAEFDAITNPETQKDNIQDESLQLFEDVYLPYANREKTFTFNSVKTFANSCGYTAEIVEPTNDTNATIKISVTNGDYVYFSFSPINSIDTIITVSFYHAISNSEVSLSNFSSDGSASYDTFDTHIIGEQSKKVSGTDAQYSFLFGDK